jgi:hypothetical protein
MLEAYDRAIMKKMQIYNWHVFMMAVLVSMMICIAGN